MYSPSLTSGYHISMFMIDNFKINNILERKINFFYKLHLCSKESSKCNNRSKTVVWLYRRPTTQNLHESLKNIYTITWEIIISEMLSICIFPCERVLVCTILLECVDLDAVRLLHLSFITGNNKEIFILFNQN